MTDHFIISGYIRTKLYTAIQSDHQR